MLNPSAVRDPGSSQLSSLANATTRTLFAASYRTKDNRIVVAEPDDLQYLTSELSVEKLNGIHDWLWIVGWPMPPRPLHLQRVKLRDIVITELMDLHLVWSSKRIYIKPIPRFLLDHGFWEEHLCTNHQLYECAMGFLRTYAALIEHESDYKIAKETNLLPEELSWSQWVLLVAELLNCPSLAVINKRYTYGELRLNRLNMIYRLKMGEIRGYLSSSTCYSEFFKENINSLIALFAYVTVALSAMQVGLATDRLRNDHAFQDASFIFAMFSLLALVFSIAAMVAALTGLFLINLNATLAYRKRRFDASGRLGIE